MEKMMMMKMKRGQKAKKEALLKLAPKKPRKIKIPILRAKPKEGCLDPGREAKNPKKLESPRSRKSKHFCSFVL